MKLSLSLALQLDEKCDPSCLNASSVYKGGLCISAFIEKVKQDCWHQKKNMEIEESPNVTAA